MDRLNSIGCGLFRIKFGSRSLIDLRRAARDNDMRFDELVASARRIALDRDGSA